MAKIETFIRYNDVDICGYNGCLTDLGKKEGINAIVNAANNALCLGWSIKRFSEFTLGWSVGGVANAIRKKAGRKVMNECREIIRNRGSWLNPGEAVYTSAGELNIDYIIHVASTTFLGSNEEIIRNCVQNSIMRAYELDIGGIAFPLLGGGAGRMKVGDISRCMQDELQKNLCGDKNLIKVVFALPLMKKYGEFRQVYLS